MAKNNKVAEDGKMRSFDHDGRLRVELTNISKANICPYWGREIPNAAKLGLDPDKVYKLFRDPSELKLAADTSNGIPLMISHLIDTPENPQKDGRVGALGTDAMFDGTYLKNSLVVWDKYAIDLIESGKQQELSCAYQYEPMMGKGKWQGEEYDGVMRNIKLNHVALVDEGRAGHDVRVADSMPADMAYDSMPFEFSNLIKDKDMTLANDKAKDKAKDEDMEDAEGMDNKEDCASMDGDMDEEEKAKDKKAKDKKARDKKARDKKARDEKENDKDDESAEDEKDDDDDKDDEPKAKDSKFAMDAIIKEVRESLVKEQRALREAEAIVSPVFGMTTLAMDSADKVYDAFFAQQGINVSELVKNPKKTMAQYIVGSAQKDTLMLGAKYAQDNAMATSFESLFPSAAKIKKSY